MRGKALPGVAGYLWRKAAMHPSVCALRRIHRPVCGARIARRALKHACALRPLRCREAAKTGAVSEGRSYVFYRRTGDNKRSDSRLPHEKQLSPPQAALDSAAPCRGGFANGFRPKASPVRGGGIASAMTEGCGALPCQYPSGPPQAPPGGRERPPYNARQTGGISGDGRHGGWMTVMERRPSA